MELTKNYIRFTHADFMQFPNDGKRHELIDGDHIATPSPVSKHQIASRNLLLALQSFVEREKLGEVFAAPFDVILSEFDTVEPDLIFIRAERVRALVKDWVRGAPDLVIEILSPSSEKIDRGLKKKLYEKYGIAEYWIVDPDAETIEVYVRRASGYRLVSRARGKQSVKSELFAGLTFVTAAIFRLS